MSQVTTTLLDPQQALTACAVSYLRVSTKEQAEKDGQDEGYSIPAQREANARKAASIGAVVVEEFVDAGESARSADRPDLMRMIEYVRRHQVHYCIVHKVDRLARNRADDVAIHLALREAGVMLVSATENIDETPSGMLLHGIMSSIAEFYSRNLATEVIKGMTQKARAGGTPTRAPIGYLNVHRRDEVGRELRTVEVDAERAPHVQWAFQAYATGNWTLTRLRDELTTRGLRSVPTPKRPPRPLQTSSIHKMLTNPYYRGELVYRGARYQGAHQPIVPAEVWYQVQAVLRAHVSAVERTQDHDHYLKGTLFCGQCGSRLIIAHARSRQGLIYPYFVCAGRHSKRTTSERRAVPIDYVEWLIEEHYRTVQLDPTVIEAVRAAVVQDFDQQMSHGSAELTRLTTRRRDLEAERVKLLQAHYADAVPLDLLKTEQDRIGEELRIINARIDGQKSDYQTARTHLDDCLALLVDCHAQYLGADDQTRRLFNQAVFERIYLDEDGDFRADYTRAYRGLLDPDVHRQALARAAQGGGGPWPDLVHHADGSNNGPLVRPTGLEPAAFCSGGRRSIH
jgi:site-specific DNA recombinase